MLVALVVEIALVVPAFGGAASDCSVPWPMADPIFGGVEGDPLDPTSRNTAAFDPCPVWAVPYASLSRLPILSGPSLLLLWR